MPWFWRRFDEGGGVGRWRLIKLSNGVNGLNNGKSEEKNRRNKRHNSPRVSEVGVDEIGAPHVPGFLAVVAHAHPHHIQHSIRVHSNVLRERVEQFRNGLIAAQSVHQNPVPVEKRYVHLAVDDGVHEEYVRGDVVSRFRVEPLKGDEIQEHVLGGVVNN